MVWPRQRLRMVGSNWCAASLASTKRTSPGGSSSVLSSALAVTWFICSAVNQHRLAAPAGRGALWKTPPHRAWLPRGFRGWVCAFVVDFGLGFFRQGQPSSIICTSGISTHRSAWVRTSMAWQLAHWPHAPCGWVHRTARRAPAPGPGRTPHARGALQQPRVATLREQGGALRRNPRRQCGESLEGRLLTRRLLAWAP